MFQDPATSLNPRMSIGDCIGEPLHVQTTMADREIDAKVVELLESVELPPAMPDASRTSSPVVSASASAWPAPWRSTRTC